MMLRNETQRQYRPNMHHRFAIMFVTGGGGGCLCCTVTGSRLEA